MSANLPDTPSTPTGEAGGITPVDSRLDLSTAVKSSDSGQALNERTRLLAKKPMLYIEDTDSGRGHSLDSLDVGPSRGDRATSRDDSTASKIRLPKATRVAKKIRQRSKYYVPVTEWLPQYSWSLFSGDLVAGISVACLMIPQALSYASGLAHLNPVAGLWSSSIPVLVYGGLGTCRQLSMGPEASLSLMMGHLIDQLVFKDPHSVPEHPALEAAAVSVITTFQCGLITTVLGLLRLGFLDVVLSRALLRGFITAIGVIIFIEQSVVLLGLADVLKDDPNPPTMPLPRLFFIIQHIHYLTVITTIVSACCLGFLIGSRIFKQHMTKRPGGAWLRFVPEILIVVVTTTVLTSVFRWDLKGLDILGKVKSSTTLPFGLPLASRSLKYFNSTFSTAFVMAIVGVVDSMVAARENATKYGYPVSPNRELVALGATNLVASCMTGTGCVPIFGSLTRSRLNGKTGCRTPMAGIITALIVLLSIFFFLPWLHFLPRAVLASVITTVVYGILAEAPHEIMFYWRMGAWTDFLQMVGTFLLTIFFSIEIGVVVSVVFSLILVIQRSTKPRITIIGRRPDSQEWEPIDEDEEAPQEIPGVLVVRIREDLSFANTGQLKERLRRLELYGPKRSHPSDIPRREQAKAIILHMGDVEEIDASALMILGELVSSYSERGVGIYFTHLRKKEFDQMRFVGIPELLGPQRFHPDVRSAMSEVESLGFGTRTSSSRYASVSA